MAEVWLTAEDVAAWLDKRRPRRGEKPRTADTARTWLRRHYHGEIRVGISESGRGRHNLYLESTLEVALASMIGQGGPGKPRPKRTTGGGDTAT